MYDRWLIVSDSLFFVVQLLCPALCNPTDCSMPGFPVLNYLIEFPHIHLCWVSGAIQPFLPLTPPSPPALNLSQHQGLFQWVSFSHQVAKVSVSASVLPVNIQDWFPLGLTGLISLQSKGLSRVFSSTTVRKHPLSVLRLLYGPILTSVHDYWKNHSFDDMDLCWQSDVSAFNTPSRFVIAFLPRSL